MRIADLPQVQSNAAQDPPSAHPAALQPALSARRSFGQGLWWPGAAGAGGTDPGAAGATDPSARLSRSSSVADDSSRSTDAETGSGTGGDSDSDSGSDSGSSSDSDSRSSGGEHGEAATGGTPHGGEGEARSAVALELVDLSVDNIDVIEPHNLTLQVRSTLDVACERAVSDAAYRCKATHASCRGCILMRNGAGCRVSGESMTSSFVHHTAGGLRAGHVPAVPEARGGGAASWRGGRPLPLRRRRQQLRPLPPRLVSRQRQRLLTKRHGRLHTWHRRSWCRRWAAAVGALACMKLD